MDVVHHSHHHHRRRDHRNAHHPIDEDNQNRRHRPHATPRPPHPRMDAAVLRHHVTCRQEKTMPHHNDVRSQKMSGNDKTNGRIMSVIVGIPETKKTIALGQNADVWIPRHFRHAITTVGLLHLVVLAVTSRHRKRRHQRGVVGVQVVAGRQRNDKIRHRGHATTKCHHRMIIAMIDLLSHRPLIEKLTAEYGVVVVVMVEEVATTLVGGGVEASRC